MNREVKNMATTVNNAFSEFMKEKVNLDQVKTKTARSSRDNLIDNILEIFYFHILLSLQFVPFFLP